MSDIDVWKIASELENEHVPKVRKEVEEFINSLNGQSLESGEIIEKVIFPLLGINVKSNKEFTIKLVQKVIDELQKDK